MVDVTRAGLAAIFGVSHSTVAGLCSDGIIVGERHRYDRDKCILDYCAHLRAVAARHGSRNGGLDLTAERSRLAIAQTREAELRIEIKKREFIPRTEAGRALHGIVRVVRQHVLGIPGRFAIRVPGVQKEELRILEELARDALISVAATDVEDVFKSSAN